MSTVNTTEPLKDPGDMILGTLDNETLEFTWDPKAWKELVGFPPEVVERIEAEEKLLTEDEREKLRKAHADLSDLELSLKLRRAKRLKERRLKTPGKPKEASDKVEPNLIISQEKESAIESLQKIAHETKMSDNKLAEAIAALDELFTLYQYIVDNRLDEAVQGNEHTLRDLFKKARMFERMLNTVFAGVHEAAAEYLKGSANEHYDVDNRAKLHSNYLEKKDLAQDLENLANTDLDIQDKLQKLLGMALAQWINSENIDSALGTGENKTDASKKTKDAVVAITEAANALKLDEPKSDE